VTEAYFVWRRRLRLKNKIQSVRCKVQNFVKTLQLRDGSEVLVEVRVTPLDDGGV